MHSKAGTLKTYPQEIQFKYTWRKYQKRVLDDLENYLDDNHLHIIAPPGSGKTVLGLEVAIRLNKPTLIFAPTIAIRNQWIQRFCELFLQVETTPDWISSDIKNPGFLTVVTYQSLHAASTNSHSEDDEQREDELENEPKDTSKKTIDTTAIVKALKEQNVGTIVVDEAHHLKNEWWKSLDSIKKGINPTIVGLTATPPYDVSFTEWQRYVELNGPVDAEISVPELVVENDLCPHQDYLYLSEPTSEEKKVIADQREKSFKIFEAIKNDETLVNALLDHPIYKHPIDNIDWIYNNIQYYSSLLIFLNGVGKEIPKTHLKIIGNELEDLPLLNYKWIETLLSFYLFVDKENFNNVKAHRDQLIRRLKRNGVLDKKSINLTDNQKINRSLCSSLSKLQSIDNIVDIEHDTLGNSLRMVILTDYIRKEFLINEPSNELVLNKIGVLPIFEQLRRSNDRNIKIGILSGSLIVIPKTALEPLLDAAKKVDIEEIPHTCLAYDSDYVIIHSNEKMKHNIVALVTNIFEQGHIEVLIGTKSLLGEGWDAPSINSLILASFVGSYVLSNQMRGRAIRSQRDNPNKTGNIWHLACVDRSSKDGGEDLQLMKRRFKSFVGVSNGKEITIENGINRLHIPNSFSELALDIYNGDTIKNAQQRDSLKEKWSNALLSGKSLTEEIKIPFPKNEDYNAIKTLYYNRTVTYLIGTLVSMLFSFSHTLLQLFVKEIKLIDSYETLFRWLLFAGIAGVLFFGAQFYNTIRIFFKYRDISDDIQQIGDALLKTLTHEKQIETDEKLLHVVSSTNGYGGIYCRLDGGTTYEKSLFIKALHEIISAIDNPKYVIVRKSLFLNIFSQKDYHSVPEIIAKNKKPSEYFKNQWEQFVGPCELIYTRTIEGRKMLLQSRINSLSSEFEDSVERMNKWR